MELKIGDYFFDQDKREMGRVYVNKVVTNDTAVCRECGKSYTMDENRIDWDFRRTVTPIPFCLGVLLWRS